MSDPERGKLDELAARIREAKGEKNAAATAESEAAAGEALKASRIGFDFMATVIVCVAVGWLVDRELGSKPWGMLVLSLAGFAAGIMNVYRALGGYSQGIGWRKRNDGNK